GALCYGVRRTRGPRLFPYTTLFRSWPTAMRTWSKPSPRRGRPWRSWPGKRHTRWEVALVQHISGRRARAFRLQELTIGQRAAITRKATAREVLLYMGATGDLNPIYLDRNYAARTPLGEPVVPAVLLAGYVFALLTQRLPGPGTVSLSQSLLFLHPVRIGDTVTVTAEVTAIDKARGRVRLRLVARNQRGQEVLSGDAEVLPPHDLRPVLSEAFEDYD